MLNKGEFQIEKAYQYAPCIIKRYRDDNIYFLAYTGDIFCDTQFAFYDISLLKYKQPVIPLTFKDAWEKVGMAIRAASTHIRRERRARSLIGYRFP